MLQLRLAPFGAVGILALLVSGTLVLAQAEREASPVEVPGGSLVEFDGADGGRLAAFSYDPAAGEFTPIPFQFDEKVFRVFNQGTPIEFGELIYDVDGLEDGTVDTDDEVVFLFGDAGPAAPAEAGFPAGADDVAYEIRVSDPRPGAPDAERWVYLFTGDDLPLSTDSYVTWDLQVFTAISSDLFALEFEDSWLLTAYRVESPCGDGSDLIDRLKGRAGHSPANAESEQVWNENSIYMGGLQGPVRAIRYVRGAASGVNTIHHDKVYRKFWERTINLRVHPLEAIWLYLDWLPNSGTMQYTASTPAGFTMNGIPDGPTHTAPEPWVVLNGPGGGMVQLFDIPPSPFYADLSSYFRDDFTYDDATRPEYPDQDDQAYGNFGFRMLDVTSSEIDTIPFSMRTWPLCANEGDAALGATYQEMADMPLEIQPMPRWRPLGAVRTLTARREMADVVLEWQPVTDATSYRVYYSDFPDLPQASWTLLGEVGASPFRDVGAAALGDRYYSVLAVGSSGEGPW